MYSSVLESANVLIGMLREVELRGRRRAPSARNGGQEQVRDLQVRVTVVRIANLRPQSEERICLVEQEH